MQSIAAKSMQRMCTTKLLNSNVSFSLSSGPATEALKRTAKNETLKRTSKRQRTEDPATLEGTRVTKEFDMTSVFAELPTNDEAFPSISWDFDDAFGSDAFPAPLSAFPQQDKGALSPLVPSPTKRRRTGGLVRSKSIKSLDLPTIAQTPASAALFDLDASMCLARDLGDAILSRSCDKERTKTPDLFDLLNEANAKSEPLLALQF